MNKIKYNFFMIGNLFASMALSGCLEKNAENKIKDDLLSSSKGLIKSADIRHSGDKMEIEAISGYAEDFGAGMWHVLPFLVCGYLEAYDDNLKI